MLDFTSSKLFAGLGKEEVGSILAFAVKRKFKPSETIIRAELNAGHLVIVNRGFVDFYVTTDGGHEILLRRFVPGNVFGIATMLAEPLGYLGTATAVNDVEVYTWERRQALQLGQRYPRFAHNAFHIALHYIAIYARRHISLVSDTAQERLASVLTDIGSRAGQLRPDGVEVEIKNEDLASLADVGFFTTSRLMKKWEEAGAVAKSRGRVLIRCPEKLLAGGP